MPCRVGITTRPEERKEEWKARVTGFHGWQLLERTRDREKAQQLENHYAKRFNCIASGGGDDPESSDDWWYVYSFVYSVEN